MRGRNNIFMSFSQFSFYYPVISELQTILIHHYTVTLKNNWTCNMFWNTRFKGSWKLILNKSKSILCIDQHLTSWVIFVMFSLTIIKLHFLENLIPESSFQKIQPRWIHPEKHCFHTSAKCAIWMIIRIAQFWLRSVHTRELRYLNYAVYTQEAEFAA